LPVSIQNLLTVVDSEPTSACGCGSHPAGVLSATFIAPTKWVHAVQMPVNEGMLSDIKGNAAYW